MKHHLSLHQGAFIFAVVVLCSLIAGIICAVCIFARHQKRSKETDKARPENIP